LSEGMELDAQGRPIKLTAIPLYFLASHAAELFLKAALLKHGFDVDSLRKYEYRHNLAALLVQLRSQGGSVSDETAAVVSGLSTQHMEHALRYNVLVDDGKRTYWPPLALVFASLDELSLLARTSNSEA
jgi:hypothetical protein